LVRTVTLLSSTGDCADIRIAHRAGLCRPCWQPNTWPPTGITDTCQHPRHRAPANTDDVTSHDRRTQTAVATSGRYDQKASAANPETPVSGSAALLTTASPSVALFARLRRLTTPAKGRASRYAQHHPTSRHVGIADRGGACTLTGRRDWQLPGTPVGVSRNDIHLRERNPS
jgi:hypothetical protein